MKSVISGLCPYCGKIDEHNAVCIRKELDEAYDCIKGLQLMNGKLLADQERLDWLEAKDPGCRALIDAAIRQGSAESTK